VAQVVEHLPSLRETLSSNPVSSKEKHVNSLSSEREPALFGKSEMKCV
jgi:hypothetical protein